MNEEHYLKKEFYHAIKFDEQLFEFLQSSSLDGLWYWDLENPTMAWMNDLFWETLGYDPQKMLHQPSPWENIIHPDDLAMALEAFQKHCEDPSFPYDLIIRYHHAKGHVKWIRCRGKAIRNEQGKPVRMVGAHTDITEIKLQEEALLKANQRLGKLNKLLLEAGDLIFILDADYRYKDYFCHPSQQTYIPSSEFLGKKLTETGFPKAVEKQLLSTFEKAAKEGSANGEYSLNKAGTLFHYQFRVVAAFKENQKAVEEFVVIVHNVTETKERKIALRESQERLQAIAENFPNGSISLIDKELNILYTGGKGYKKAGIDASSLAGTPLEKLATARVYAFIEENLPLILGGQDMQQKSYWEDKVYMNTYSRVLNEDGSSDKFVLVALDITKEEKAESELFQAKEMLEQTNNLARVGGWELDVATKTSYWSKMVYDIHEVPENYQLTLKEGLSFYKAGKSREIMIKVIKEAMAHGTPFEEEIQLVTAKGREIWVKTIGRAKMVNGKCERLYGAFYDIDKQKKAVGRLQNNYDFIKNLTAQTPGCLFQFTMGGDNQILWNYISEACGAIYEVDPSRILSNPQHFLGVVDLEDIGKLQEALQVSFTTLRSFNNEHRIITPSGAKKWIAIKANPKVLPDGSVTWYGYLQDVSVEKIMLEELAIAKKQAEEGSSAKSAFIANMSHEIRTPLNSVIGFSDLMLHTDLDATQIAYMQYANQSAKILMGLIEDILDFSKIDAGKLVLEEESVNIRQLVDEVMQIISFPLQEKGLTLIKKIAPQVPEAFKMDAQRIKQMLINLLNNAIKFTDKGTITIDLQLLDQTTDTASIRISVQDTGIGIAAHNHEKIFQAFVQEDNSIRKKYGGSGLGLNITNKLLGLMNSTLRLESELGKGSNFFFDLDLKKIEDKDYLVIDGQLQKLNKYYALLDTIVGLRILIVDDNKVNRILANSMIKKIMPNSHIIEAESGLRAMALFRKEKPDIIFMDIQMPYMNGYEATQAIREMDDENTPIIALTAGTLKGERQRCLDAGMDDYLSKPIIIEKMKEALVQWLKPKLMSHASSFSSKKTIAHHEHFDFEFLKNSVYGDIDTVKQLLSEAANYLADALPRLEEYIAQKNEQKLREELSDLSESAFAVGCKSLGELAIALYDEPINTSQAKVLIRGVRQEVIKVQQTFSEVQY